MFLMEKWKTNNISNSYTAIKKLVVKIEVPLAKHSLPKSTHVHIN